MAVNDASFSQHAATEILIQENKSAADISD
jgi:hypothetical protein